MTYLDNLIAAMSLLAEHPRSVFLGQSIVAGGTAMTQTFRNVPREKMIELPVIEDLQMGIATGLSLAGDLPITIYPRINFLLLAVNQLVLHLDALPRFSEYRPKVIIRTAIASPVPLDPGPQHLGDYSQAFRSLLATVTVVTLDHPADVLPAYRAALERPLSTLLIERAGLYDEEN